MLRDVSESGDPSESRNLGLRERIFELCLESLSPDQCPYLVFAYGCFFFLRGHLLPRALLRGWLSLWTKAPTLAQHSEDVLRVRIDLVVLGCLLHGETGGLLKVSI